MWLCSFLLALWALNEVSALVTHSYSTKSNFIGPMGASANIPLPQGLSDRSKAGDNQYTEVISSKSLGEAGPDQVQNEKLLIARDPGPEIVNL